MKERKEKGLMEKRDRVEEKKGRKRMKERER
jgi:hypothetical protein